MTDLTTWRGPLADRWDRIRDNPPEWTIGYRGTAPLDEGGAVGG
ncbi:hypothetical protein [Actinokineospora globicatena]|nr:hypothetical protein [Actinokineospora globicatena]